MLKKVLDSKEIIDDWYITYNDRHPDRISSIVKPDYSSVNPATAQQQQPKNIAVHAIAQPASYHT